MIHTLQRTTLASFYFSPAVVLSPLREMFHYSRGHLRDPPLSGLHHHRHHPRRLSWRQWHLHLMAAMMPLQHRRQNHRQYCCGCQRQHSQPQPRHQYRFAFGETARLSVAAQLQTCALRSCLVAELANSRLCIDLGGAGPASLLRVIGMCRTSAERGRGSLLPTLRGH